MKSLKRFRIDIYKEGHPLKTIYADAHSMEEAYVTTTMLYPGDYTIMFTRIRRRNKCQEK